MSHLYSAVEYVELSTEYHRSHRLAKKWLFADVACLVTLAAYRMDQKGNLIIKTEVGHSGECS